MIRIPLCYSRESGAYAQGHLLIGVQQCKKGLELPCRKDCFFHAGKVLWYSNAWKTGLVLTCMEGCVFHAGKVFGTPMHGRLVLTCRKVCFFHAGKVFGAPMHLICREGFWNSNAWKPGTDIQVRLVLRVSQCNKG